MRVKVFYHDKCFDGACSASLFTRFHRECIAPDAAYEYHGLVHRAGALFDESEFTGDENAIVDFKYSASPKITWWFDHHLSAFLTPQDHENFLACQKDPVMRIRKFFDPEYTSCTSFLAYIGSTKFGFNTEPVKDLIYWANIVDGALYESAEAAVEMAEPAMKLTLIIESTQDPEFIPKLIPLLTEMPLSEVLAQPFVASPAAAAARASSRRHRADSRPQRRAWTARSFFDITDRPVEGYNKFIPYYLHPQGDVLDRTFEVELPDQGVGRFESVDQGRPRKDGEPGAGVRALRRRRARAGGRDQLSAGPGGQSAAGRG